MIGGDTRGFGGGYRDCTLPAVPDRDKLQRSDNSKYYDGGDKDSFNDRLV